MATIQNELDVIDSFLKRKERNLSIKRESYEILQVKKKFAIKRDPEGNIIGSLCSYCAGETSFNPIKNCKEGVSVAPLCKDCLQGIRYIEPFLEGKTGDKIIKRRNKINPDTVNIDWTLFETQVKNGQAGLAAMAKTLSIYPDELKKLIIAKYGDKVEFKRGRGGGIKLK